MNKTCKRYPGYQNIMMAIPGISGIAPTLELALHDGNVDIPFFQATYIDDAAVMSAIETYFKKSGYGYTVAGSKRKHGKLVNKRIVCFCHSDHVSKKKTSSRKYKSTTRRTDCPWSVYLDNCLTSPCVLVEIAHDIKYTNFTCPA